MSKKRELETRIEYLERAHTLTGEKFERIMKSLSSDSRTPETAATVMLVTRVTNMANTVQNDLASESAARAQAAREYDASAASLRRRAENEDRHAKDERARKNDVDGLMALLPIGGSK